ncbi:uncharacterized protein BT62DRAFT_733110 [Guyanagaster necrorhizus]|uniref:Uncharacterized protein n=1 Tax=Guyanagaster necrorhizus TaxID=856835 RepID=A0A9P8AWF5_9AGAR|nr:uncharacterized protein BT62DRAFT_733110 [Guyanagaster necrorhizus MCA 3950]KAG7448897.1 hypothetical protein BT62DRAFT_733110 [Guyanagaster necrorhizus MCA 3950]
MGLGRRVGRSHLVRDQLLAHLSCFPVAVAISVFPSVLPSFLRQHLEFFHVLHDKAMLLCLRSNWRPSQRGYYCYRRSPVTPGSLDRVKPNALHLSRRSTGSV